MERRKQFASIVFLAAILVVSSAGRADISKYELLGIYPTDYPALDVRVKDNIAYFPSKVDDITSKLDILDVSNPANITLLGSVSYTLPYSVYGVSPVNIILDGDYAYIAMYCGGFVVIDTSDKENPQLVSSYSTGCGGWGQAMHSLLIDGDIMYVGWDYNYGLGVFDISDPYNPTKITNRGGISFARKLTKKDNYVFVSTYYGGYIRIFDVSNPAVPVLVNSIKTYGSAYFVGDIADDYYYMPDNRHTYGVKIYDVTDPENHVLVSQINTAALGLGWINNIQVYGNEAIAAFHDPDFSLDSGFVASFDVTNPHAPEVSSILNVTPKVYHLFEYANNRLYLPASDGLYIWGIPDTDGDGLSDEEELAGWEITIYDCEGNEVDSYHVTSDPCQADEDDDGLNDSEEKAGWHVKYRYQLSPPPQPQWIWVEYDVKSNPREADIDADGLNDWKEKVRKTDPNRADTDCDSAWNTNDGFEIDWGLNPLDFDTDGDGLSDGLEIDLWIIAAGYSPDEPDTVPFEVLEWAVSKTNDPDIPSFIDIDPDTLNLKSKGKFITCYIELPEDYLVEDVDIDSIAVVNIDDDLLDPPIYTVGPSEIGDYDNNGISDLMVKFDRHKLIALLEAGDEVEITVTGELTYGTPFKGSSTIRVIDKGSGK